MKKEQAVLDLQHKILVKAILDNNYGKRSFSFTLKDPHVYFGGCPSPCPMWLQASVFAADLELSAALFPETWKMALNPITWVVGRNEVSARVEVSASGTINITYRVEGNMNLDTEDEKSFTYKLIAKPLDKAWQTLGGSASLPTYGAWHVELFKKK